MGGEPSRGSIVTRMCWWLVNMVSRMLESDEREVVLGDFAESKEPGSQALCDVLGLVVRRQAILWVGWRRWLTLAGLILPLGMLLSVVSRTTSDGSAVYIWLYANNWDWALLSNPGFWRLLAETIVLLFLWYLTLACRSWTAGFVLGSVSRGMMQINGVLLCLMFLFGELVGAPRYLAYCEDYLHRTFGVPALPDYNAAVFDVTFYRAMFPLIVQTVLVALSALWGMRQGTGAVRLGLRFRVALWTAVVATLAAMVIQERGLWLFLNGHIANAYLHPGLWMGWAIRLLQFVVFWPVVYLVANAIGRRWHGRMVPV
jgi:hypothetical protein